MLLAASRFFIVRVRLYGASVCQLRVCRRAQQFLSQRPLI